MYQSLFRPLLFKLDPETAHEAGMKAITSGLLTAPSFHDPRLEQTLFGAHFSNPIGLAAGFDKNAVAIPHWKGLSFGFAEVGTVTHHPQLGNPKPRMFRVPEESAIVNRMGFNNDGAEAIADRFQSKIKAAGIPIGVNLGKSKKTPLGDAPKDYADSYRLFNPPDPTFSTERPDPDFVSPDYFVINVSSPNTPGLRTLQEKPALIAIIQAIRDAGPRHPLFIKVAPDLEEGALGDVLDVAAEYGLTGVIATNTTIAHHHERGGLSGAPLRARANEVMRFFSTRAPKEMVLIGVGGIFTADDLWERIQAGAHLCQIYTGWIYGGPNLIPKILEEFTERMDREGVEALSDIRGA